MNLGCFFELARGGMPVAQRPALVPRWLSPAALHFRLDLAWCPPQRWGSSQRSQQGGGWRSRSACSGFPCWWGQRPEWQQPTHGNKKPTEMHTSLHLLCPIIRQKIKLLWHNTIKQLMTFYGHLPRVISDCDTAMSQHYTLTQDFKLNTCMSGATGWQTGHWEIVPIGTDKSTSVYTHTHNLALNPGSLLWFYGVFRKYQQLAASPRGFINFCVCISPYIAIHVHKPRVHWYTWQLYGKFPDVLMHEETVCTRLSFCLQKEILGSRLAHTRHTHKAMFQSPHFCNARDAPILCSGVEIEVSEAVYSHNA